MSEQNINIWFFGAFRRFAVLLFSFLTLTLAACLPTNAETVNTELFKDKEDLKQRAAAMKPSIPMKKAFEMMGIEPDKFQRLNMAELQATVYGNSMVQGTPEQLEAFSKKMMSYEGYALPYRFIKSDSSLGFGMMKVQKTGQDLRLVLVFQNGKLFRCTLEGTEQVKQENDQSLWPALLQKGIGFAF